MHNVTKLKFYKIKDTRIAILWYNKFDQKQKYTERSVIRMSNILYSKNELISSIKKYFLSYFSDLSKPTQENLILLILGMYSMESFNSVRSCYKHLLKKCSNKSINAYYETLSNTKLDPIDFIRCTVEIALSIIPKGLTNQPVFLSTDDTIAHKHGTAFANVKEIYDHASKEQNKMVNGHNFVSLMLSVPVQIQNSNNCCKIKYIPIPLGYEMKTENNNKLDLVITMVDSISDLLSTKKVIFSFDTWYAKKRLIEGILKHKNMDIICNARIDSVFYALPSGIKSGKKGRPAIHGKKYDIWSNTDFDFSKYSLGKYDIAHHVVIASLFGKRKVHAYVTKTETNSRRLYFSTINTDYMIMNCSWQDNFLVRNMDRTNIEYSLLSLYRVRWNIEVSYYEQKTFWSLEKYMVRGSNSIKLLINLINVAYSAMKILPYYDSKFSEFINDTPQELRMFISEKISNQIFFSILGQKAKQLKNADAFLICLNQLVDRINYAA